jgi:hypothetical protein
MVKNLVGFWEFFFLAQILCEKTLFLPLQTLFIRENGDEVLAHTLS